MDGQTPGPTAAATRNRNGSHGPARTAPPRRAAPSAGREGELQPRELGGSGGARGESGLGDVEFAKIFLRKDVL